MKAYKFELEGQTFDAFHVTVIVYFFYSHPVQRHYCTDIFCKLEKSV